MDTSTHQRYVMLIAADWRTSSLTFLICARPDWRGGPKLKNTFHDQLHLVLLYPLLELYAAIRVCITNVYIVISYYNFRRVLTLIKEEKTKIQLQRERFGNPPNNS